MYLPNLLQAISKKVVTASLKYLELLHSGTLSTGIWGLFITQVFVPSVKAAENILGKD